MADLVVFHARRANMFLALTTTSTLLGGGPCTYTAVMSSAALALTDVAWSVWSQLPLVAWVPSCGWMVCYALRPSTRPASSVAPRSRPALAAGAGEKVDAPTRDLSLLRR